MFAHVTSEPHSLVDEERAEFLAYQASFADAGEA
jgi:2-oxoisovalerate dehydrogenase E1 component alpha subunit